MFFLSPNLNDGEVREEHEDAQQLRRLLRQSAAAELSRLQEQRESLVHEAEAGKEMGHVYR